MPLPRREDLLTPSLDPRALRRRFGPSDPLLKFASNGGVREEAYAEAIVEFKNDAVSAEPESSDTDEAPVAAFAGNSGVHKNRPWFQGTGLAERGTKLN